jgi:hypothetical protein
MTAAPDDDPLAALWSSSTATEEEKPAVDVDPEDGAWIFWDDDPSIQEPLVVLKNGPKPCRSRHD